MDSAAHRITEILDAARGGDETALDRLLPLVYDELRRLAQVRTRGPRQSLQPTELVHEAWMKLVRSEDRHWQSRRHFVNAAGVAMRNILIDRARARLAQKHGGGLDREPAEVLEGQAIEIEHSPEELLALDAALSQLEAVDERSARVVTLRFFAGLSSGEIADALGVSDRTVRKDWGFARAWLERSLGAGNES